MAEVSVLYRERPFAPKFQRFAYPEGMTVNDIIDATNIPRALFDQYGVVLIGDQLVPKEQWNYAKPKAWSVGSPCVYLGIGVRGGGGGGGGKSTLAIVAEVAILAATLFVGGGGLALLGASSALFGGGTIGAALAAGAISIGGSLALAALTPAPSVDNNNNPAIATQQQGSSSLSGNAIGPGDPVSRCYGSSDVNPQLLCNPLQELIGLDEFVEVVYGLAGPHKISDIRVDNIPIDLIPYIEYQVVEGKPNDAVQDLVTRQSFTVQPSFQLTRPQNDPNSTRNVLDQTTPANSLPAWYGLATRKAPDEFWITLAWSGGLSILSNTGADIAVPVRLRFRPQGSTSWTNAPEVHFSSKAGTPMQKHIKLHWQTSPLTVPLAPTTEGPWAAFSTVPAQTIAPAGGGWQADPYFNVGSGTVYDAATFGTHSMQHIDLNSEGVEIYLDPSIFPQGQYEVQIIAGSHYAKTNFTASSYQLSGVVFDLFGYSLSGSTAILPVDRASVNDAIQLVRFSSVWNENPILTDDFATISVRAKNASIGQLTVFAEGYTYDWDGSEWANFTTTDNPAPHLMQSWTRLIDDPAPLDIIDNDKMVEWRTFCTNNNFETHLVATGKSLSDVQTALAAAGRGRVRQAETWYVSIDKDETGNSPIQIFTAQNSTKSSFEKAFPKIPTGFRVTFRDKTNDYQNAELIVLRPGLDPSADDGIYEQIQYDTIIDTSVAITQASYDLGQLLYRSVYYKRNVLLDYVNCAKGSLVGIQDDILTLWGGGGFIEEIQFDTSIPPKITGFVLSATVPDLSQAEWSNSSSQWSSWSSQWKAPPTGIQIRQLDQSITTTQVVGPTSETNTLVLSTPMVDPSRDVIDVGCLISFGVLGSESKRCKVFDITPKSDFTADLTLVDEAPQLTAGLV